MLRILHLHCAVTVHCDWASLVQYWIVFIWFSPFRTCVYSLCIQLNPAGHLYDLMQKMQKYIPENVKIWLAYCYSASASGGLRPPDALYRGFGPGPHWGTSVPQTPWHSFPATGLHHKYHDLDAVLSLLSYRFGIEDGTQATGLPVYYRLQLNETKQINKLNLTIANNAK